MTTEKTSTCKHPPSRYYSWFAYNPVTDKSDILCVGCCECGAVLAGAAKGGD